MSTPPVSPPPGWYADPNTAGTLRWWDGTAWSSHFAPGSAHALERPPIAAETKVDGVWIWLVALLPLVSIATFFLIDFRGYMQGIMAGDISGALNSVLVGYFVTLGLTWAAWGAAVLFSYFDWRDLRRAGVVRPFHWAWSFFYGIVYLIGRTVILRKVSSRGFGPLWAGIAVYVIVFIAWIVWTAVTMTDMMQNLTYYAPSGSFS